jgi:hypothetical protein
MEYDTERDRMSKIHDYFSFPVELDMNKYIVVLNDEQKEKLRRAKEEEERKAGKKGEGKENTMGEENASPSSSTVNTAMDLPPLGTPMGGMGSESNNDFVLDTNISSLSAELLEKFSFIIPGTKKGKEEEGDEVEAKRGMEEKKKDAEIEEEGEDETAEKTPKTKKGKEKDSSDKPVDINRVSPPQEHSIDYKYTLHSVLVHSGTIQRGYEEKKKKIYIFVCSLIQTLLRVYQPEV